jgi:hypothetical protein
MRPSLADLAKYAHHAGTELVNTCAEMDRLRRRGWLRGC